MTPRPALQALFLAASLAIAACQHAPPPRLIFAAGAPEPRPDFAWDAPGDPYLAELRTVWDLDRFRGPTDLDTVRAVNRWVSGLWEHDGRNQPRRSDALSILAEVKRGQRFRCVEYAIVVAGCLNALGIPARTVGLMTADVETSLFGAGHVVAEAWLRDQQRWIMVDGQWGAIPFDRSVPLDAVTLQAALAAASPDLRYEGLAAESWRDYERWIAPYLHYFQTRLDNRTSTEGRRVDALLLVPGGSRPPKVFQRGDAIRARPIWNAEAFYPAPSPSPN